MPEQFTHGYALLVGVGESAYPNWSLPVTVRDVRAIEAILTDAGLCGYPGGADHIRLLHDAGATKQAILDGLAWLEAQAAADLDATVVVYYSGHGWLDDATGRYYLVPHDVEPFDLAASALPAEAFAGAVGAIAAKRLLVFVDSCHAEGMATSKDAPLVRLPKGFSEVAMPKGLVEDLKQGQGRAVFTSSRGEQRSWIRPDAAMSIYTYHLVEALQGAGNQIEDKLVRISNLMNHLGQAVPESAQKLCHAEQVPFFDTATEDFPVALLRGGKGLPIGGWEAIEEEAGATMRRMAQEVMQDVAIARGEGAQAASGGSVVAGKIEAPISVGKDSIAAGGDVVLAEGGSKVRIGDRRTQIGGSIQAGQIQARNVVSGVQTVGAAAQPEIQDLKKQVAALREELARALVAGQFADEVDAEDADAALATAEQELSRPEPRGERILRKLEEVKKVLERSADAAQALGRAGVQLAKLAVVAHTLWQVAQKLFGG